MGQRTKIPFTVLIMTVFFFSFTSLLLSIGGQYPARIVFPQSQDDYDTSFWNLTEAVSLPVTIDTISSTVRDYEKVPLDEWYFTYESESLRENNITINSVILKRANISERTPTILFLHGYGEEYLPYIEYLRELAAIGGFIVMAIDHPGEGNSTGLPELSPLTFLNVTTGPQDANLYHSVLATVRAITLLYSLSYVDDSAIVVSGDSMGAWTSLIVSAIDKRVDGTVSMIAAGNLMNSILIGSLVNTVIEPSYVRDSDEMHNVIRWFDPIAYARILTQPTLMLFGSNDDFFPMESIRDTVDVVSAPLTLNIIPNYAHGVYIPWFKTITKWMNNQFNNGDALPSIHVSSSEHLSLVGAAITVNVNATDTNRGWICWRTGEPGGIWFLSEMMQVNEGTDKTFTGEIVPLAIGKVTYFVIMEQEDSIQITSRIYIGTGGSLLFPLSFIVTILTLLILLWKGEWKPKQEELLREVPYILGIFLLVLGFSIPFTIIEGRATISVLDIVDLFGNSFFLKGWFLPSFIAGLSFVISLSAYRHRFPFRTAGILWTAVLIILIILFFVLSAIFGFFGSLVLVNLGPGGPVFLVGIIVMQLLDNNVRKRVERRITHIVDVIEEIID